MSIPSIQKKSSFLGIFKREKHPTKTSTEKTSMIVPQKLQESLNNNNNLSRSTIPVQLKKIPQESSQTNSSAPNQVTLIKPKPTPLLKSVQEPIARVTRSPNKEGTSVFLADIIQRKETLRKTSSNQKEQCLPIPSEQINNKGILRKTAENTHPDMNQTSTKKRVIFDSTDLLHQNSETTSLEQKKFLANEPNKKLPPVPLPRSASTQLSSTTKKPLEYITSGNLHESESEKDAVHRGFDQLLEEMNAMVEELKNYSIGNEKKNH